MPFFSRSKRDEKIAGTKNSYKHSYFNHTVTNIFTAKNLVMKARVTDLEGENDRLSEQLNKLSMQVNTM